MLMAVTLRQIQAFLAVAELGSFTKAAERLNMAQPALSQLVRDLEHTLRIRLLDRTTRRVELTEAGREFFGASGKILHDLDLAIRNTNDLVERRRGRITVAAPPLLCAAVLPAALKEMRLQAPGVRIAILDVGTDQIIEAVRTGRADCGLGTFAIAEEGIERIPMARDKLMLFCAPGSPLAEREVDWSDLREEPLITLTRDSGIRHLVDVAFANLGILMSPAYEVSQITTALALVEAELGVALLPTYAQSATRLRTIVAKPLSNPTVARDIVMIRPSGRSMSPAVATFEAVLRRHVRRFDSTVSD